MTDFKNALEGRTIKEVVTVLDNATLILILDDGTDLCIHAKLNTDNGLYVDLLIEVTHGLQP